MGNRMPGFPQELDVRKKRCSLPGRGKSGGLRLVYSLNKVQREKICLFVYYKKFKNLISDYLKEKNS